MDEAPSLIIGKIRTLLPLLLLCMILVGLVMFAVVNIVPRWKVYQELQAAADAGNKAIEAQLAQSDDTAEIAVLQHRIESSQTDLAASTGIFMSTVQADAILQKLYTYAKDSTVEIENLQTQHNLDANQSSDPTARLKQPAGNNGGQAPVPEPVTTTAYSVRALRIMATGSVPNLLRFMTRIREISVAGIAINNLNIKETDVGASLVMDLLIYTSPLSDGKAYENLPEVVLPTPLTVAIEPTAMPTPITAEATAEATEQAVAGEGSITIVAKDSVPAEPALNAVYSDNFDSGNLNHWKLGAGWILFGDPGAKMLQATDASGDATFAYDTLNNAAVQMRVLMSSSSIRLTLRQSSAGWYGVVLQPTGQVALYRGDVLIKTTTTSTSSIGRWRDLRLSVVQGIIRVSIDGVEVLTARDSSELPPGTFSFRAVGRGIIRVDDVQLWSLDTNTPF
ncbi:MAG: hypothetical protein GC179_16800 [Anaerolineaceae bacterium]|nr:hypothetical protein [Anaerolineaceae bacterium]